MQGKDIPDDVVLDIVRECERPRGMNVQELQEALSGALKEDVPINLVLAKGRGLIRRGLISGCGCGCRGDFTA